MDKKTLVISGIVALIVALIVVWITPSQVIERTVVKEIKESLGALVSPDISSNYLGIGGQRLHYMGANLTASSTACSFSPDFGTTTVRSLSFQTVGTTSATILVVAKATNDNNATTTALTTQAFSAGTKGTLFKVASTTDITTIANDGVDGGWTLSPNDVLNFDVQGLVQGGETFANGLVSEGWTDGTCGVELWIH